jgi:hypothetical protein
VHVKFWTIVGGLFQVVEEAGAMRVAKTIELDEHTERELRVLAGRTRTLPWRRVWIDARRRCGASASWRECLNFCVQGVSETCPRRRASLATNDRRGGQVGAAYYAAALVNRSS